MPNNAAPPGSFQEAFSSPGILICSKCGLEKDLNYFNKHRTSTRGYQYWCRECVSKYQSRPSYQKKANNRRSKHVAALRCYNRYRRTPEGQAKLAARRAVSYAVRTGKMQKSLICQEKKKHDCVGRIEADHYLGYSKENILIVRWICARLHRRVEKERRAV